MDTEKVVGLVQPPKGERGRAWMESADAMRRKHRVVVRTSLPLSPWQYLRLMEANAAL